MSDAISDHPSVSSPQQNITKSRLLNLKEKIDKTVQEYNEAGIPEIPKKIRKELRDRLTLTWVSTTKRVSSTKWRNERAQDVYRRVLATSPHLYVAFISIIAPTACIEPDFGRIVTELLHLAEETSVRLKLNLEAKEFFDSVAEAGAFTEDHRYVRLIHSLFPEDHSHLSRSFNSGQASPNLTQHSIVQNDDSSGPERSVAPQSPAFWGQENSITSTEQRGLQHRPGSRSQQHGHAMDRDLRSQTLQSQSSTPAQYQGREERPSKRLRLDSEHIPGNLELPGQGQYYSFSCMRRPLVENLPEPFRKGLKTSNFFSKEQESGGLAITNGLKIYVPERINEDFLFVLRLGYTEGFNIFDLFGFGDSDTPEFKEAVADE